MKNLLSALSMLLFLSACGGEQTAHTHQPNGANTPTTAKKNSTDTSDRSQQFVVGAGFGWRKKGSPDPKGAQDMELALSYGFKIYARAAVCDTTTKICQISQFELRQDDNLLLKFPQNKGDQFLIVNLERHECPLLLKKAERVLILLPHQRGNTPQSIVLDGVKIENGKFVEVLPNMATWRDEILPQVEAEQLFARAFPQ